jgi:acyl transferase domain-containing protein
VTQSVPHNPELAEHSEIAAINSESHFVIALPRAAAGEIEAFLAKQKVAYQRMPVSRGNSNKLKPDYPRRCTS